MKPPESIVLAALEVARTSPCAKSKRGALIFNRATDEVLATGRNFPAPPLACDGSEDCRDTCAKRCVHAEQDAIIGFANTLEAQGGLGASFYDVLHVRLNGSGELASDRAPSPSCWQCSREVSAGGFRGIWLFEHESLDFDENPVEPRWVFWPAREFHLTTLKNCGVHIGEVEPDVCACGRPRASKQDLERWEAEVGRDPNRSAKPDPEWSRALCWISGKRCNMKPLVKEATDGR